MAKGPEAAVPMQVWIANDRPRVHPQTPHLKHHSGMQTNPPEAFPGSPWLPASHSPCRQGPICSFMFLRPLSAPHPRITTLLPALGLSAMPSLLAHALLSLAIPPAGETRLSPGVRHGV